MMSSGLKGGKERAAYGRALVKELSRRLTDDFGRGFNKRNLWSMRKFYLAFSKVNALRSELSWTHYRSLSRVADPEARAWYECEALLVWVVPLSTTDFITRRLTAMITH